MTLNHAPGCPGPDVHRKRGSKGDLLDRCAGCGWFDVVDERPTGQPSPWWCREHEERVTWKGTGCPWCAQERAEARARREERAAERADRRARQAERSL